MKLTQIANNRWVWFLKGMPSFPRANALFQAQAYTMGSPERCRALWMQSCDVIQRKITGDFVECGVWRGGASAIMALAARHMQSQITLHLFDSFEGLPEPSAEDGSAAAAYSGGKASGSLKSIAQCQAGVDEVKKFLIEKLQLDPTTLHFHVGWFQNTLPAVSPKLGPIALLRLDGDWYESTKVCLEYLYPKLVKGGMLLLDDYNCWAGCKKATEEYRQAHGISAPMHKIDKEAIYWIKE